MRDGVSINQERRKETIVIDSQFIQLDDLEAYMRLPGDWPVVKVKFEVKERAILDNNELIKSQFLLEQELIDQTLGLVKKDHFHLSMKSKKVGIRLKKKEESI